MRDDRLEILLNVLPVGIVIIDAGTRDIIDANSQAVAMIGRPVDQLAGRKCYDLICRPGAGQCPVMDPGTKVSRFEHELIDADGHSVPVLKTAIKVEINGRNLILDCMTDISEQQRATAEAKQKERLQGVLEMAGAVSHELNQPLQVVTGYVDMLIEETHPDAPIYADLALISGAVRQMGDITRKLMRITRYETRPYANGRMIVDLDRSARG